MFLNLHSFFFLFMRALPSNSNFISFVTMPYFIIGITAEGYSFFSSFFILHFSLFIIHSSFFISKVTCSFFFCPSKRKRTKKENSPSAHLALKIAHVFGRAARHLLRRFCGAALSSKNAPDFLHAPDVRTELYLLNG